jgi:hypothetical protein
MNELLHRKVDVLETKIKDAKFKTSPLRLNFMHYVPEVSGSIPGTTRFSE